MSHPRTTQDLYGEAFRRLDALHDGARRFRVEVERVKDVYARPVSVACCSFPSMAESVDDELDDDRRVRPATPRPPVEAGLEEFRLVLSALRAITL